MVYYGPEGVEILVCLDYIAKYSPSGLSYEADDGGNIKEVVIKIRM